MSKKSSSPTFLHKIKTSLEAIGCHRPKTSLILACSLGPDSMAMTLALLALQKEWDLILHGVYVDHGLRPESKMEAQQFLDWAKHQGLSAETVKIQIPKEASKQAAARRIRYQALVQIAQQKGALAIVTGHTLNDQSETFLMRLLGGAGLRGLSGMPPSRVLSQFEGKAILLARPLLDCTREEVLAFLKEKQATPLHDPSNTNLHYLRSRIRHQILPILRKEHPEIDHHFGDLTKQFQHDSDYLDQEAQKIWYGLQQAIPSQQQPFLPITTIQSLHPAIAARVLQNACPVPLSFSQIQILLAACQKATGSAKYSLNRGWIAERIYERLFFTKAPADHHFAEPSSLLIPGIGTYQFGQIQLKVNLEKGSTEIQDRDIAYFPTSRVFPPFTLRFPQAGDRITLVGLSGTKKLSDFWIDAKIPKSMRKDKILLCDQTATILWLVGFRASQLGFIQDSEKLQDLWVFRATPKISKEGP